MVEFPTWSDMSLKGICVCVRVHVCVCVQVCRTFRVCLCLMNTQLRMRLLYSQQNVPWGLSDFQFVLSSLCSRSSTDQSHGGRTLPRWPLRYLLCSTSFYGDLVSDQLALTALLCGIWIHSVEACQQLWQERAKSVEKRSQSTTVFFRSPLAPPWLREHSRRRRKKKKPNKPYDTKDEKIHDFGGGNNDMYFVRVLSNPCKLPQPEFLVLLFLKHAGWFWQELLIYWKGSSFFIPDITSVYTSHLEGISGGSWCQSLTFAVKQHASPIFL